MKFLKTNWILIFITALTIFLLFDSLDKPYIGHHDWNGAFWGSITRNYLNYLNSDSFLTNFPRDLIFTHYTPFMPILFAISAGILGMHEYSLRLVSVFFSVIMVIFTYKIGKVLYGNLVGFVAAVFLMATPMFLYFGKMPDHEPIVTSLATVTLYFYIRHKGKNTKHYFLFLLFLTLALLESWPAYFLLVPLTFISLFVRRERLNAVLVPILLAVAVLAFHLIFIFYAKGFSGAEGFFLSGIGRASTGKLFFGATEYAATTFVSTEARYAVIYFTRILLFLSGIYVASFVIRLFFRKTNTRDIYLFSLFVYPTCFILTFRELAFIHDYKLYHFLPFITLSAAVIFCNLLGRLQKFLEDAGVRTFTIKLGLGVIMFATWALVYFERLPYLKTLQATSFNTPGYELGKLIKERTETEDYVLVNSREFKEFYEVFVTYYSDRVVEYDDLSIENYEESGGLFNNYKYIIFVKDRPFSKDLFEFLAQNHPSQIYGDYTFFSK